MTPFCTRDPNEATRGFRFWQAGFWKGALGERPYHISALFVVDLARFRSQAAIHRWMVGSRREGRTEGDEWIEARETQPSIFDLLWYQAAGDTYRATYHALTADPSSLSNLDQDLPNYLQQEVCPLLGVGRADDA